MEGRRTGAGIIGIAAAAVLAFGPPAWAAEWRRVSGVGKAAATALASDATGGRLAAAVGETIFVSEDGGARWHAGGRTEGQVADLLFLRRGPLAGSLAAAGPWGARVSRDGQAWQPIDLAGAGTRGGVRTLAEDPRGAGAIALGTEAGVLVVEPGGERKGPVLSALAGRSVDRLAWDEAGTIHAASEEGLYRIDAAQGDARRALGRPTAWVATSGAATLALTDRGYLVARGVGAFRDLPGTREMAYLGSRFSPEPGASLGFLAAAPRRLFRVRPDSGIEPLGDGPPGEEILALLPLPGGRVLAGTDRGLFETVLSPAPPAASARDARLLPSAAYPGEIDLLWREEPGIEDVRRAVLRANQLGPGRMIRAFHGARWRALLPTLSLSALRQATLDRDRNADQTFSSSAIHDLFDESSGLQRRREFAAVAEWDLGALLFNPDELDVSEESRRLVILRDDVLDEVSQIYFERRRAILALVRMGGVDGGGEEAIDLRIRIDEQTAKLDAWTDGYFSREIARRVTAR